MTEEIKKICNLCYREFEEDFMKGDYCFKCLSIIGKGSGYKNNVSEEEADKWFEGIEERKKELKGRDLI